MIDIFGSVKSLLKLGSVRIDNDVFRLHYKMTTIMLVFFAILVTCRQYIGDPIDCITNSDIKREVVNTFCWIHSTYTVSVSSVLHQQQHLPHHGGIAESSWDPSKKGKSSEKGSLLPAHAHPGVRGVESTESVKYHKYYQWVCFVLFFQAILFYVPRYIWQTWEGGRIKKLVFDLHCPVIDPDNKRTRKKLILDYFVSHIHSHDFYAYQFFFCELLNSINVFAQIYLTDIFLDYEFTTYGSRVLGFMEEDQENREDPMSAVFPKVTKCTFNTYGLSGNIVNNDVLCVLPINNINEKIYVFLWFWFICLAFVSTLDIIYRLATILIPPLRWRLLCRKAANHDIKDIANKCKFGDWFLLYQLGRNITPSVFRELISDLANRLNGRERKYMKRIWI